MSSHVSRLFVFSKDETFSAQLLIKSLLFYEAISNRRNFCNRYCDSGNNPVVWSSHAQCFMEFLEPSLETCKIFSIKCSKIFDELTASVMGICPTFYVKYHSVSIQKLNFHREGGKFDDALDADFLLQIT